MCACVFGNCVERGKGREEVKGSGTFDKNQNSLNFRDLLSFLTVHA